MKFIPKTRLKLTTFVLLSLSLTACNQPNNQATTPKPASATASTTTLTVSVDDKGNAILKPASVTVSNQPLSTVKLTDPLNQLLATTLNNGFLLAIKQNPKLNPTQKQCLTSFDTNQSVKLAQDLLQKNLSQTEVTEANEFYQLPIGQKIVKFNQQMSENLKNNQPASQLDVTDDEKLQISAFIQTSTGQKIQQLAQNQLYSTFAPIESAQLQKCQVTTQDFNASPASATATTPKVASQTK